MGGAGYYVKKDDCRYGAGFTFDRRRRGMHRHGGDEGRVSGREHDGLPLQRRPRRGDESHLCAGEGSPERQQAPCLSYGGGGQCHAGVQRL